MCFLEDTKIASVASWSLTVGCGMKERKGSEEQILFHRDEAMCTEALSVFSLSVLASEMNASPHLSQILLIQAGHCPVGCWPCLQFESPKLTGMNLDFYQEDF